jgi:hypothetical protein
VNGSVKRDLDLVRISAGLNDEVVFKLPIGVAVVDDIDAGVNVVIPHTREMRHIGPPSLGIIAEIVVADARKPIERFSAGVRVCVLKGQHDLRFASLD